MLVRPARRDVGEDSDGDNLEQQHQGIGEAAHGSHQNLGGRLRSCAVCRGERGGSVCVLRLPSAAGGAYTIVKVLVFIFAKILPPNLQFRLAATLHCCRK